MRLGGDKSRLTSGCVAALALIFGSALLLFFPSHAEAADHITASGCSVSVAGYLTDLAKEYERRTGVMVLIRGGGSVIGIEDLRSGSVDFAAACRPKSSGDPEDIQFIQVAWDALVFIVHKSNPLSDITLKDVRSIYDGHTTNWKELKGRDMPIKVFFSRSIKGLSGVEMSVRSMVLGGKGPAESPNLIILASTGIVEQMVEEEPEGFAATGYTSARKRRLKMLNVNGIPPTIWNITSNRYPLKRPLFLLVPKNPKIEVKRFIDFVLSREGQLYIRSLKVIPLKNAQ